MRDFWNLPEYSELLQIHQTYLGKAFRRQLSHLEALTQMTKEEQAVIDKAYPNGPIRYLDRFDLNTGVLIGLLTLVGLTMVAIVVLGCLFWHFRDAKIIRYSSPIFGVMILLGLFCTLAGLLPYAQQPPNKASCNFHLWLTVMGVFLTICPLTLKIWRIFLVYNRATQTFSVLMISNQKLFVWMICSLLPLVVLLAVWTGVDPNGPVENDDEPNTGEYTVTCSNDNLEIYLGILIGYLGLFGVCLTFLSIVTRNVTDELSESRYLALIVYNGVILGVVVLPLIFYLSADPTVSFAIEVAGFLAWSWFILAVLFIQKIIRRDQHVDISTNMSGGSQAAKSAESGSSRSRDG